MTANPPAPDPTPASPDAATAQTPAFAPPPPFTPPPVFSAPVLPARRRGTSLLTTVLLVSAAAVAVAGISFAVGRLTAPVAAAATDGRQFAGFGNGNGRTGNGASPGTGGFGFRGAFGGVGLRGTVTAVNGLTLTVKLANGQEITVQTDASTTYHRQVSGASSDVTSGSSIIVQLQPGSGGFGQGGATTPTVHASDITVAGQ